MSTLATRASLTPFRPPPAPPILIVRGKLRGHLKWTAPTGTPLEWRLDPRWVKELLVLQAARVFDERTGNLNEGFMLDDDVAREYNAVPNGDSPLRSAGPKAMSSYRTQLAKLLRQECARHRVPPLELFEHEPLLGVRLRQKLLLIDARRRPTPPPPTPSPFPGRGLG